MPQSQVLRVESMRHGACNSLTRSEPLPYTSAPHLSEQQHLPVQAPVVQHHAQRQHVMAGAGGQRVGGEEVQGAKKSRSATCGGEGLSRTS